MKTLLIGVLLCIVTAGNLFGQEPKYPFPQNVKYPYGVRSSIISNDMVKRWYTNWKTKYLQTCNSNIRPATNPISESLVEAQGFAMVAVAYMGDKETFDKLYAYYKSKCTTAGCGLMGWKQTCDNISDQGSATDGDIDVACALVVANWQWPGGGYDEKAKSLITTLKKIITTCSGKLTVYPGCSNGTPWGGCSETDISYYTPAFFRYFAKITGDSSWSKLADDTQLIRDAAANATTGLVPDWQSVDGRAGSGSRVGYFGYDAVRAPYKQTLDYLWYGTEKAGTWAKKLSTWANGIGVKSLKDGYQLNGTTQGSNHNMAVVGSFAVAAMANTQQIADAFAKEVVNISDDFWYSSYLGNLYLLALTGNMWNPEILETSNKKPLRNASAESGLPAAVMVKTTDNAIIISGVSATSTTTLLTLGGQKCSSVPSGIRNGATLLNTSKLQRGCYIIQIEDRAKKRVQNFTVSIVNM